MFCLHMHKILFQELIMTNDTKFEGYNLFKRGLIFWKTIFAVPVKTFILKSVLE